jgi:hypothetical protein
VTCLPRIDPARSSREAARIPTIPSTLAGTGFTVNGANLEMQYQGATAPSANFISYRYVPGYVAIESPETTWIRVTAIDGAEIDHDRSPALDRRIGS